jgi:hypothetical protein
MLQQNPKFNATNTKSLDMILKSTFDCRNNFPCYPS